MFIDQFMLLIIRSPEKLRQIYGHIT